MKNNLKKLVCLTLVCITILTGTAFAKDTRVVTDIVGFFRNVHVNSNEEVRGSVVAIFGNAEVDGQVNGDVVSIFGHARVKGTVTGSVVAVLGGVNVSSTGKIQGDVVQVLGGRIQEEQGSQIWGARVGISSFGIPGVSGLPLLLLIIFIFTLVKLIIGYVMSVIAVLIFPQKFENMGRWVSIDISRRFLIGILVVIGYYVVAAMLVMVVLGAPFVLLIAPIMLLLGFTGNTAVKLAIGNRIAKSLDKSWSQMMRLFMGTLVYAIIDLTIIGKSATFVAKATGIGAVIDSNVGTKNPIIPTNMGFISLKKDND